MSTPDKKHVEYTKIIFTGVFLLTVAAVVIGCHLAYKLQDSTIMIAIISGVFAELATHTAVYAWKTKTINKTIILLDFINNLPDDVNTKEGIITAMINNIN